MIEASTDVVLGEVIGPAGQIQKRVYGLGFAPVLLFFLLIGFASLIGPWIGYWLYPALGSWSELLPTLILVLVGFGCLIWYVSLHRRGFLNSLKRLGSPDAIHTVFRFDTVGIQVHTDRLSHRLPWSAIQILLKTDEYWLLQIDITTLAVPRRAFATDADEAAFVELAKGGMSPAARERSVFENH